MTMHEPSVLEVNLSAIDRNMAAIRRLVGPECRLCPIVKADAYGLGAARVARRVATAGADLVAVYSLPQAAELGASGLPLPVLVLMPVREIHRGDECARLLASGRLHLTLHDAEQADALAAIAEQLATRIPVHLEVDTGMSRGGIAAEAAASLLARVKSDPRFLLAGVFTHFSDSRTDGPGTDAQLDRFDRLLSGGGLPEGCLVHVASTYALLRHARYHRSMVRFGLAWAGYGREECNAADLDLPPDLLSPCLRWRSRIVHVKRISAGTAVGYGSIWRAKRPSVIGLVPVGYADGFPLFRPKFRGESAPPPCRIAILRDSAKGLVREYAPVVGTVNMDQITVDLTDIDPMGSSLGASVELISPDRDAPNHLPRLAGRAGMIPHEMLCRIHPRIPRLYVVGEGAATEQDSCSSTLAQAQPASQAG